jgi:SAM-dependent methyltransferase
VLDGAAIAPGEAVADVGTGLGLLALGAVERVGPDGDVLAFDVSVDCLEELRRFARAPNIGFYLGAAEVLPLPDASVDVVMTRSVLMYVPDRGEAAREFLRVLRSGGRASIFEPINRRLQSLSEVVDFADDAALVREWEAGRLGQGDPMLEFDEHDLERAFVDAGFADVRVDVEMRAMELDAESLLVCAGAPGRAPLLERWRADLGDDVADRLAARVGAHPVAVSRELPRAFLSARKA